MRRPLNRPGIIALNRRRCWHEPCIWFPPGWYYGHWYPAGWLPIYADEFYWFGWYGYEYHIGEFDVSGLKFDLDNIPEADRKTAESGIVYVDRAEIGTVKQFAGRLHSPLHLAPKTYEVSVQLADGRELNTTVAIMPGHVTHVLLRFSQKPAETKPPAGPWLPQSKPEVLENQQP